MSVDRFKATINGGIPLGKAGNLAQTMQYARPQLEKGAAVYVRRTDSPGTVTTFVGFPPEASTTNAVGDPVAHPSWVRKALQAITY